MQNLTLTGWSPFRCMCLWYKKQSKYSVQIFFCNSKLKISVNPPLIPKDRVPKTISNLLQSPPIYTDSVASRNESFHFFFFFFFMYIQNIFKQLKYTTNPTGVSLHASTNDLTQCKVVLSLAEHQRGLTDHLFSLNPSHTLTQTYRNTHTHTYTRHNE